MSAAACPCAFGTAARPDHIWRGCIALAMMLGLTVGSTQPVEAYTPDSPEVQALVNSALAYLEKNTDPRLGGKCLIALAFHKRGMPDTHPRIVEAVAACRAEAETEQMSTYVYGKALVVIFLSELDAGKHAELIRTYAEMITAHQKPHGGFGYTTLDTGDTSQTQYAALAYWELLNHGISPDAKSVQNCLNWLLRTQDPSGAWGYQGEDPGHYSLVQQNLQVGRSMAAAGMGSTLILGNALGLLSAGGSVSATSANTEFVPAALKRVESASARKRAPTLPAGDVDPQTLTNCLKRSSDWWAKNFGVSVDEYPYYYLYSIERLKSFEGYLEGSEDAEPDWYDAGVEYLQKSQQPNGSWSDNCGPPCATAFATLFLLRSTQQSIKASLGEGTLIGGRGLPRDLSKVRLQGGRLVVQQQTTELDQLLDLMESGDGDDLDGLVDNPAALEVTSVTPDAARRLQQIVRSGSPQTRLLAVRALAKARDLDFAPTLIFALTDPDREVVRAARDALKSVSRSFTGFGPTDNFDENERQQAIVRWKAWYRNVRPDAAPLP